MKYIDCHCDTITELKSGESLQKNKRNIDIEGLIAGECKLQCCSMFIPTGTFSREKRAEAVEQEYQRILSVYRREMKNNADVLYPIYEKNDLLNIDKEDIKKTGIMLTIEDGGVLLGDINRLYRANLNGVRLITLTWNHENEIGYPNSSDKEIMNKGLKPFGFEVLEEMCRLGMAVDVSHLSDGGFLDVYNFMKRKGIPFVASHSNARELCPHQRNLPDEYIRKLADAGGIMGLNFASHFLNSNEAPKGESRIEDMVYHALHLWNAGGEEILAIGSDFDGVESKLEIDSPKKMYLLWEALYKAKMPERVIEKMFYGNASRVFKQICTNFIYFF